MYGNLSTFVKGEGHCCLAHSSRLEEAPKGLQKSFESESQEFVESLKEDDIEELIFFLPIVVIVMYLFITSSDI